MLIQITAAQGPAECALAVSHTLKAFKTEAAQAGLDVELLEQESGPKPGTLQSVVLTLQGAHLESFLDSWQGTVQWTCPSPYRPRHKSKNWFVGLSVFDPPSIEFDMAIRYESCRASGSGGQHVNNTDSAVRATHIATGLSVTVQLESSQHANKRLARQLIAMKLEQSIAVTQAAHRSKQRDQHLQLERGNPIRVYKGERFTHVK